MDGFAVPLSADLCRSPLLAYAFEEKQKAASASASGQSETHNAASY